MCDPRQAEVGTRSRDGKDSVRLFAGVSTCTLWLCTGLRLNLIISMKRPAGAEGIDREHGIQMDKRGLTSAIFPPRLSCCLSVSMAAVFMHHVL